MVIFHAVVVPCFRKNLYLGKNPMKLLYYVILVFSIFSRKEFYSRIFLFFILMGPILIFFQALDWLFTCLFCWSSSTGRYFIRLCNRLHTPQCLFGIPIMEILPRCKQLHIKKIISIHTGTLTLAYDSNVYQSKGAQRNTYWIKLKVIYDNAKSLYLFSKTLPVSVGFRIIGVRQDFNQSNSILQHWGTSSFA